MIWTTDRTFRLLTGSTYHVGPAGRTNRHIVLPVAVRKIWSEIIPSWGDVVRFLVADHPTELGGLNGAEVSVAGRQQIAASVRG